MNMARLGAFCSALIVIVLLGVRSSYASVTYNIGGGAPALGGGQRATMR
jgi:hypothetical protein